MANLFISEFLQRIASDRVDLNCPFGYILLADTSLFIESHRLWSRTQKTLSIAQSIGLIADSSEMVKLRPDDQFFLLFFYRRRHRVFCFAFSGLFSSSWNYCDDSCLFRSFNHVLNSKWGCCVFSSILRLFWQQQSKVICIIFSLVFQIDEILFLTQFYGHVKLFLSEFLQRIASDRGE